MPQGRPAIPVALKRAVMEEAGYRCAVPQCRGTAALEIAHISPWSKVKEHSFENLIVLCAVDHQRFDSNQIPRQSIETFKSNLGLLRGRYSDPERRILEAFARELAEPTTETGFPIPGGTSYTVMYLVQDGLVLVEPSLGLTLNGLPPWELVLLTPKGVEVVTRLRSNMLLDDSVSPLDLV